MITKRKRKIILVTLRKVAKKKGISSYEIARRTGIARPNVVRMTNGKSSPSLDNVLKIADAIGVNILEAIINQINKSK